MLCEAVIAIIWVNFLCKLLYPDGSQIVEKPLRWMVGEVGRHERKLQRQDTEGASSRCRQMP